MLVSLLDKSTNWGKIYSLQVLKLTTRHRILGILSSDKFQLIFSDTPGLIKPKIIASRKYSG